MSKPLILTKREAQTLLRAAEAEHAIVEVKMGDKVIRLIPGSLAQEKIPVDDKGEGFM